MKKILLIVIFSIVLFGSTRGDVKLIEASENVQYLSQKIAVEYLLLYNKEDDSFLKRSIEENIKRLQSSSYEILEMTKITKSSNSKKFLPYLNYSLDDIKNIISKEKSIDNVNQILDYAEHFIEVANAIIEEHKYDYTKEEKMLMLSKKAQYLFEYVISYYMAAEIGISSDFRREKMYRAIAQIDNILTELNEYNYSKKLKKKVEEICTIWSMNKSFFTNKDGLYIPNLLVHSNQYSQDILEMIERYHKKNL